MAAIALVLGSASCVWDDVEAALALGEFAGVVACNDAGVFWPGPLDIWVSLHADKFKRWTAQRELRGLAPAGRTMGPENGYRFPDQAGTGSSGHFALKVALDHFDRAVLCGVPMTEAASHIVGRSPWTGARHYRAAWQQALPHTKDRARSMSGWTAELHGKPDALWFQD